MKIGILGTGNVGRTIGGKLVAIGHEVRLGSRTAENAEGKKWAEAAGPRASVGTFADAAAFGEVLFNCTAGVASLDAIAAAGGPNLTGKVLIDVSNPLDFSKGFPPSLTICNTDSLGEQIQRAFPEVKVVKSLNTLANHLMVDPARLGADHDVFVAGNDPGARAQVAGWLREWFGWKAPIDLGDITASRGLEMWLLLWVRMYGTFQTGDFNLRVVRKG